MFPVRQEIQASCFFSAVLFYFRLLRCSLPSALTPLLSIHNSSMLTARMAFVFNKGANRSFFCPLHPCRRQRHVQGESEERSALSSQKAAHAQRRQGVEDVSQEPTVPGAKGEAARGGSELHGPGQDNVSCHAMRVFRWVALSSS